MSSLACHRNLSGTTCLYSQKAAWSKGGKCSLIAFVIALIFFLSGGMAAAEQTLRTHPSCSGGGPQAEELFMHGLRYSMGLEGFPFDKDKTIQYYEEAMDLGSAKAAINLGTFYGTRVSEPGTYADAERYAMMNSLYKHAINMGCPDGYYFLAISYAEGWGVERDMQKSDSLIKQGVEAGSYACMFEYAMRLARERNLEEAKQWLHRALDGGYIPAAAELRDIYIVNEENSQAALAALRQGAKLGGVEALSSLADVYLKGLFGQAKDEKYGNCFLNLAQGINEKLPPVPIDLDSVCPPRAVAPYRGK
jgi:TPR repeat protein